MLFVNNILLLFRILPRKYKTRYQLLILFMVSTTMLELVTIGSVIPLYQVIIEDEKLEWLSNYSIEFLDTESAKLYILLTYIALVSLSTVVRLTLSRKVLDYTKSLGIFVSGRLYEVLISKTYSDIKYTDPSSQIALLTRKTSLFTSHLILGSIQLSGAILMSIGILSLLVMNVGFDIILVLCFILLVFVFFVKYTGQAVKKSSLNINRIESKLIENVKTYFHANKDIKISSCEGYFKDEYMKLENDIRESYNNLSYYSQIPRITIEGMVMIAAASYLFYVVTSDNSMNMEIIVFTALSVQKLLPQFNVAYNSFINIRGVEHVANDINRDLSVINDSDIQFFTDVPELGHPYTLELKGVSYTHLNTSGALFENLYLRVQSGEYLIVKGVSGRGKSTLIDIMMGLLPSENGSLWLNGVNVDNKRSLLTGNISHVSQNIYLLNDTLENNITSDCTSRGGAIDKELFENILKICRLDGIYEKFGNSYIGENGSLLSGGQRQRVAMCRALYMNKPFLFLDEATSGLDADLEFSIIKDIRHNFPRLSIVHITHSNRADPLADHIYELS
jgi:ATP-binding cassette, subfamily B, bacterial PglK